MEREVLELWQAYCSLGELWTGWNHQKTPLAFFDEEKAVLFGHPNPPDNFIQKEYNAVRYWVASPKPKSFTANTAVELKGTATATVMWNDYEFINALALSAHEAFHAYQAMNGFPNANIMQMTNYPVFDPLVNTYGQIEGKMLHAALNSTDPNKRLIYVKKALDAKASRQSLLSTELTKYEDDNEFMEGLAQYIELQVVNNDSPLFEKHLSRLLLINKNGWGASRQRFYTSGMAYGLLLDIYSPEWQVEIIKSWESLATVLAKAIQYSPNPNCSIYLGIDFSALLKEQETDTETRKNELLQEVQTAFPGTGKRIQLNMIGEPIGGGWNPYEVQVLPTKVRFHPTILMYNYSTGSEFSIKTKALELELCRKVEFERPDLQILVNDIPYIKGETVGNVQISGEDVTVFVKYAQIRYDGDLIIIDEIAD